MSEGDVGIEFRVEIRGVGRVRSFLRRIIPFLFQGQPDALEEFTRKVWVRAREKAPIGWTGLLVQHVEYQVDRKALIGRVMVNVPHAVYVISGTQPHWIGANILIIPPDLWRFIGLHPGQAANPFLTEAFEEELPELGNTLSPIIFRKLREAYEGAEEE